MKNNDILKKFYSENKELLQHTVIKNFLQIKKNQQLLINALIDPSNENKIKLDLEFRHFYLKIKMIKYISNLIHFYTIDFDKRINLRNQRYQLILDSSISEDSDNNSNNVIDSIPSSASTEREYFENKLDFDELVEDEELIKALKKLTIKQIKVLEMIYILGLNNKEVAHYFNETPQNISNIHKQSLKKLKKHYIK